MWKHWYSHPRYVGRHFLIYSKKYPNVKRQYTICNSLVPKIYKELMTILEKKLKKESLDYDFHFDATDRSSIYITCKDYHTKTGVASQLFRE